jgi:hypothetical protein
MSTRKGKLGYGVCRARIEHRKLMNSGETIVISKGHARPRHWSCGGLAKSRFHQLLIHHHRRLAFQCQMASVKHHTMSGFSISFLHDGVEM